MRTSPAKVITSLPLFLCLVRPVFPVQSRSSLFRVSSSYALCLSQPMWQKSEAIHRKPSVSQISFFQISLQDQISIRVEGNLDGKPCACLVKSMFSIPRGPRDRAKPPSACCNRYTAEDSTRVATRNVKRMVPTVWLMAWGRLGAFLSHGGTPNHPKWYHSSSETYGDLKITPVSETLQFLGWE